MCLQAVLGLDRLSVSFSTGDIYILEEYKPCQKLKDCVGSLQSEQCEGEARSIL